MVKSEPKSRTCSWCGFVLVVFLGFAEELVGVLIILTLQSGRKWAKRRWWWQAPSTNLPCLHHRAQHCPENSALVKVLATYKGVSKLSLISTFDNRHIHSKQISPFTSKSITATKDHTIISSLVRKIFFPALIFFALFCLEDCCRYSSALRLSQSETCQKRQVESPPTPSQPPEGPQSLLAGGWASEAVWWSPTGQKGHLPTRKLSFKRAWWAEPNFPWVSN